MIWLMEKCWNDFETISFLIKYRVCWKKILLVVKCFFPTPILRLWTLACLCGDAQLIKWIIMTPSPPIRLFLFSTEKIESNSFYLLSLSYFDVGTWRQHFLYSILWPMFDTYWPLFSLLAYLKPIYCQKKV